MKRLLSYDQKPHPKRISFEAKMFVELLEVYLTVWYCLFFLVQYTDRIIYLATFFFCSKEEI